MASARAFFEELPKEDREEGSRVTKEKKYRKRGSLEAGAKNRLMHQTVYGDRVSNRAAIWGKKMGSRGVSDFRL